MFFEIAFGEWEFGEMPEMKCCQELILKFEEFLQMMNISIEEIDHRIVDSLQS